YGLRRGLAEHGSSRPRAERLRPAAGRQSREDRRPRPRHRVWSLSDAPGLLPALGRPHRKMAAPLGHRSFAGRSDAAGLRLFRVAMGAGGRSLWRHRRLARDPRAAGYVDRHYPLHRPSRRHHQNGRRAGSAFMSAARRILIVGGLALALWGMAYGLWYAVFAE